MRFVFFTCVLFSICLELYAQKSQFKTDAELAVGARQTELYVPYLKGKKVAVTGNHTSMVNGVHLVDTLLRNGVGVVKVFAPEHGFRGKADAGALLENGVDVKTGLPVVSLYGTHKKPTVNDLEGIEVMVFDIQDVGARFYTYISTMTYVMEACAEQQIPVIVLDRPNPNGFYVDGPVLKPAFKSFVGMHPIPVVHGMTVGELAQMINGEGWLNNGIKCDLTVIACEHYHRKDIYTLPVDPSPNLQNMNAILLYPSLCFFEGTDFSVGRGTDKPFEVFGHPNMSMGSFMFVPKSVPGASDPKHIGVPCLGWDLSEIGGGRIVEKEQLILDWLVNAYRDFPNKSNFFLANGFFDKLAGTDRLRIQIESGWTADEIRKSWQDDLDAFKSLRAPYLIYPD